MNCCSVLMEDTCLAGQYHDGLRQSAALGERMHAWQEQGGMLTSHV